MGRDDSDIAWNGRFRGNSAERRARAVDALRIAGTPVPLAWGGFRYTVVVSEFEGEYRQAYEIPYRITCLVATDSAPVSGLLDPLGSDLGRLLGLSGDLSLQGITDAMANVQAAVATAKSLKDGFPSGLAQLGDAVATARGVVGQGIAAADSVFALAGQPSASPTGFASDILNQSAAMSQLDTLHNLAGSVGRMAATVQSLGG